MVLPLMLLCLQLGLVAQQPFSRVYTDKDGILIPETLGSFYTHDSIYWVFEYDGSLSRFDGYKYEHLNLQLPFSLNYSVNTILTDSFSILPGTEDILYKNGKFSALNRAIESYYEVEGKYFAYTHDTVYLLDMVENAFEVHHALDPYFLSRHKNIQLYANKI